MNKRIRIGVVSYLNTKPLLYGISRSGLMDRVELIEAYPANIAKMLLEDSIDIGLVPVAVIPQLKSPQIVSNYCIGANGEVASVAIFSEVPMEEITTVLLDYQSRTSVNLAKILLEKYWNKQVTFIETTEDFTNSIKGTIAGVVIGDCALEQRLQASYCYDLAEAWKKYSGLPFVFAAWVSNKNLGEDFEDAFNMANGYGLKHIAAVVAENPFAAYDLNKYYTENISYNLDAEKRKGLELFLSLLK
ncbi:MAG: menaquinone biosynthesis protein [Bacteroidetes bacterium]|nr:menaquinone biosynthesis protein [Bacteroidota bacterium]